MRFLDRIYGIDMNYCVLLLFIVQLQVFMQILLLSESIRTYSEIEAIQAILILYYQY